MSDSPSPPAGPGPARTYYLIEEATPILPGLPPGSIMATPGEELTMVMLARPPFSDVERAVAGGAVRQLQDFTEIAALIRGQLAGPVLGRRRRGLTVITGGRP